LTQNAPHPRCTSLSFDPIPFPGILAHNFSELAGAMPRLAQRWSSLMNRAVTAALAVFLASFAMPADAQMRPQSQEDLGDQPGYVPTEAEEQLPAIYQRQAVFFRSNEAPGTVIVHTSERFLYVVQGNNRAIRYGIGVGRDGFTWAGLKKIVRKSEWPDWTPPDEMIQRQPYLPRFMSGGPGNPMGARALYIGGTVYRIHGTNQPQTIGSAVSSGCFRLTNKEIIDLYERVQVGAKVIVRHQPEV
jgi:lipoprotein-anchoring transpeptidase ErfK/SrfK